MGRKKKKKKGIITNGEDRISNLPESLIHHILSFLLMRDVIRTCLLSSRWRNVWKSASVLNFGNMWEDYPSGSEFIEQSLVHYEGQKVKTLQVELECLENPGRLESWVRFATMHGVEELDIFAEYSYEETLPSCLFECLEMRVLRLRLDDWTPQPFRFPLLTELHFANLRSNYFDTSACPLLEVLIIEGIYTHGRVEIHAPNPKLRYLNISEDTFVAEDNSRLTLYAPNVLHFEFEGSFTRFYEFKDISSIKTLNLHSIVYPKSSGMAESLVQLLRNLTHVKSLKLCQACILILAYGETIGLEIPSLSATCLELRTNLSEHILIGIASLLRASRCIEQLILNIKYFRLPDGRIFKDRDIEAVKAWESLEHALSVELALNTILIQNYPGGHYSLLGRELNLKKFHFEFKLVSVLLKSTKMLNKMNISIMKPRSEPLKLQFLYDLKKKVLVFPRASVNAKVYFS